MSISDIVVTNGKIQVGIYSDANAGNWVFFDDFSLIGDGNGTAPEQFTDGKYIKSLEVNDSANRANWSIQNGIDAGTEVFGDRAFRFTSVPDKLKNAEWIRTACDSKKFTDIEARFTAAVDETVYIGLDSRIGETPDWLSDWEKTSMR